MLPISIKFQAFIPNSLGRKLLSYFKNTSRFRLLSNKEEFISKVRQLDSKGYTWLPEPGNSFTNNYFATDDVEMFHHHSEHSTRLAVAIEVKPEKIGNYHFKSEFLKHKFHENWGGIDSQHSGESHQVKVYIKRVPFYTDFPRASDKDIYIGVCSELRTARSEETPLEVFIRNSKKHFFQDGKDDTTSIKLSSGAEYPFTPEWFTPKIDFELNIELYKSHQNDDRVDLNISGWHNDFPAYELIVNERVKYSHNPADYGYTGPNHLNLSKSKNFNVTEWIY